MARLVVMEWERVLRFTDGKLDTVLTPGRHRYSRARHTHVTVDVRPRVLTVPGQDVLTADGITVKLSAFATWHVGDPQVFVMGAQSPQEVLYAALQAALRDAAAAASLDEMLTDRTRLSTGLDVAAQPAVDGLGIIIDNAAVKDLMLPGELRRAQVETVLARERGRAELERARAEAASLRSLANTAKLLEDHPALLHLRTLDAVGQPGSTVVLRPPDDRRAKAGAEELPGE